MVTHAPAFAIACHTRYGVHGVSMCLIPSTDGASMMALTPADSEPPDVHRRIAAGISKYELNAKGAGRVYRWTSRSVRYSRVRYSAFGKIERQKENSLLWSADDQTCITITAKPCMLYSLTRLARMLISKRSYISWRT